MVDSDWVDGGSVVIGEQGSLVGDLELPVEPDPGGQGEQSLADADEHPAQAATTVLFQAELVLEGVDDRLDPLAHPTQRPEPARLIVAIRTEKAGSQGHDVAFERPTGKPRIGQDDRARRPCLLAGGVVQQHLGDLALAKGRSGQPPGDRPAVGAHSSTLTIPSWIPRAPSWSVTQNTRKVSAAANRNHFSCWRSTSCDR